MSAKTDAAVKQSTKRKRSAIATDPGPESKRRKSPPIESANDGSNFTKVTKRGGGEMQPNTIPLSEFHEETLAQLRSTYDVAVMSVISSTKIRNRVTRIFEHLQEKSKASDAAEKKLVPLALVHARPPEVCKMITVTERVKGILNVEGKTIYQYNHLFEIQPKPEHRETIDETVLEHPEEEEESDDGFETLKIYEKAANPKKPRRKTKSLAIFLSTVQVPELKSKAGITEQVHDRG